MLRRVLPIAAIIAGARMLLGSFIVTTAARESFFFNNLLTPLGLALIVGGAFFLLRNYESDN